ncbi:hypothetical protein [Lacticaseibacillus jixiensis]|uniref:hypothetical protein n=1 Tax=Lacticaseibacillus jixiensis TaxID=3231926 RepID=UPI0036F1D6C0
MSIIKAKILAFNVQTYLLLLGLILVVAGIFGLAGLFVGLIASGVVLIILALIVNKNEGDKK